MYESWLKVRTNNNQKLSKVYSEEDSIGVSGSNDPKLSLIFPNFEAWQMDDGRI